MSRIPPQNIKLYNRLPAPNPPITSSNVVFSFESLEQNEYFNLDSTCENWSKDLFDIMKTVSTIDVTDIKSGKFSRPGSPLRRHRHEFAKAPCPLPNNVLLENMWQIRISRRKGGIHGRFVNNIFYVIWFDPHHNLYPDDHFGGLRTVRPPQTCCKERDQEIYELRCKLEEQTEENKFLEQYIQEL